jgi:hypothetical protein
MKNEEELDLLKKVAKIEAPPFLMTRIAAKIRAAEADRLPVSWQWAGSLAFAALVLLNVFLAKIEARFTLEPAETLAVTLKIQPSNQIYDE